jgi:hypothetical protein
MFSQASTTASAKQTRRWRWRWIIGPLLLFVATLWPAAWLLKGRENLRLRLEIEQLNGRVEIESPGPAWLAWLVDPRYFERVVAINLTNVRRINPEWIRAFHDIEGLALFNVALTEENLVAFRSLRSLKTLSLMQVFLKGPELSHLADLPSLEELRLGNASDAMAPHLAGCDHLRVLHIYRSEGFTDHGLRSLPALPGLRRIELVGTSVTEEGAGQFRRERPSLEVLYHHVSRG